jgi:hypothetical protein
MWQMANRLIIRWHCAGAALADARNAGAQCSKLFQFHLTGPVRSSKCLTKRREHHLPLEKNGSAIQLMDYALFRKVLANHPYLDEVLPGDPGKVVGVRFELNCSFDVLLRSPAAHTAITVPSHVHAGILCPTKYRMFQGGKGPFQGSSMTR